MEKFVWILDEGKFLTEREVRKLRAFLERKMNEALSKDTKTAVRDWIVLNLGLLTGLRVQEIADLKIGDLFIGNGNSSLVVKNGKNGKQRLVKFGPECKRQLLEYLEWKDKVEEQCSSNDPLILSSNTGRAMTKRGIQRIFERNAKKAGINGHSIHHLRHTYASHLLKSSKYNIKLVQQQLGHSSIKITEVYLHVLSSDLDRAVSKLYN